MVSERSLPTADPTLVVAARAKPQHVLGVDVKEDGEQRRTRFAPRTPATAQGRRLLVQSRLRTGLGEVAREAFGARRERCDPAARKPRRPPLRPNELVTLISFFQIGEPIAVASDASLPSAWPLR